MEELYAASFFNQSIFQPSHVLINQLLTQRIFSPNLFSDIYILLGNDEGTSDQGGIQTWTPSWAGHQKGKTSLCQIKHIVTGFQMLNSLHC